MAYVSLYRKYRPQTFADVVGQDHVTRTLSQAVADDRTHHAYLFTGPRGTGKTSTARILAKSLNCEAGPTPEPCGTCSNCVAITTGSSVDVIEIDAASHGGVDDVRDLRDRVAFAPAAARTKVYIVDECHMLSTAGWNAFLKTVEEPPGHVVFVFATTEPHKVLETILSRTQRFDFKRIPAEPLAGHVAAIGQREGLTFEPGVIDLVVRAGDGSARDALSVLDQVIALSGKTVTLHAVADVLGAVPDELLAETADLIAAGDVPGLCVLVGRLADAGQDLRQFARDAVEHLRRLFMLQVAPNAGLVEGTPERLAALQAQAGRLGRGDLLRAVELLAEAQAQMRRGNVRLPLELALIKAALPESSGDHGALAARMDRLERRTGVDATTPQQPVSSQPVDDPARPAADGPARPAADDPARPAADDPAPPAGDPPRREQAEEEARSRVAPAASDAAAGAVDLELVQRSWEAVLEAVKVRKRTLKAFLDMGRPVSLGDGVLRLEFRAGYRFHADNCAREDSQTILGDVFEQVLGARLRLRCTVADGDAAPAAVADDSPSLDEQAAAVLESEAAAAAGELPDEARAHELAIETLTRDLGAKVVDDDAEPLK